MNFNDIMHELLGNVNVHKIDDVEAPSFPHTDRMRRLVSALDRVGTVTWWGTYRDGKHDVVEVSNADVELCRSIALEHRVECRATGSGVLVLIQHFAR